jgi:uncharacterized membrane protein YgcG
MTIGRHALTPPEAFLLLHPDLDGSREAAKLAALTLLAQGTFKMRQVEAKGILGFKRQKNVLEVGSFDGPVPGPIGSVWMLGRNLKPGSTLAQLATAMRHAWGDGLLRYGREIVFPELEAKGLVLPQPRKMLGLFRSNRWTRTDEGAAEAGEIARLRDEARRIPNFLDGDRRQAAALIATLGAAVLLVPELRPYFSEMARATSTYGSDTESMVSTNTFTDSPGGGWFNFGSIDTDTAESLSTDPAGFDSAFDTTDSGSSDSGGDSSGDSGGDSGGGGD